MKVIFIQSHNGGRLANQLWNFVSIYAYCLEKGYVLINPTFKDYAKNFEQFKDNSLLSPNLKLPNFLNKNWATIFMNICLKINSKVKIGTILQTGEDSDAIILPPTNNKFKIDTPIAFFNGWLFRNNEGMKKFGNEIRYKFRPTSEYQKIIDDFYSALDQSKMKIAIHIRRTDYKQHLDGKYYFEIEEYKKVMKKLLNEYKKKSPLFVIFSDEDRSEEEFSEFKDVVISKNPFIVDLFLLSRCDLIVGPPSSFTQFAAWYGETKLRPIENISNF